MAVIPATYLLFSCGEGRHSSFVAGYRAEEKGRVAAGSTHFPPAVPFTVYHPAFKRHSALVIPPSTCRQLPFLPRTCFCALMPAAAVYLYHTIPASTFYYFPVDYVPVFHHSSYCHSTMLPAATYFALGWLVRSLWHFFPSSLPSQFYGSFYTLRHYYYRGGLLRFSTACRCRRRLPRHLPGRLDHPRRTPSPHAFNLPVPDYLRSHHIPTCNLPVVPPSYSQ